MHVNSRQIQTVHTHTWGMCLVETGQMFYLGVYVSERCTRSDGEVLMSGARLAATAAVTGAAQIKDTTLTMGGLTNRMSPSLFSPVRHFLKCDNKTLSSASCWSTTNP